MMCFKKMYGSGLTIKLLHIGIIIKLTIYQTTDSIKIISYSYIKHKKHKKHKTQYIEKSGKFLIFTWKIDTIKIFKIKLVTKHMI